MNNIKSLSNKDRYGNMFSIEFFEEQSVPMLMMIPDMPNGYNGADTENHPGNPKGTDTVPAWLTPGENVVNAEASRLPGNQEKIDEMNEQGRAVQQAQGGPIPTYAAGGKRINKYSASQQQSLDSKIIKINELDRFLEFYKQRDLDNYNNRLVDPTYNADGGTVYAAEGSKVYTKRMPDGRMGVWRGNTFLNYVQEENDGMLKSLRDKIGWGKDSSWSLFNSDGGQVPAVYAQQGSFITDELLDRIRRIESGGDPNATSEAGAMGQYQIMPATAAQPGYGVTPLAAEDIRDPAKSREFARQYLMGIAANNPDFTEDEVITAYHSGVGNVRKAKEGTEALGPRGQAYAGKVNNAEVFPQELIDRGVTPSDLTQSDIESGMFSANAATVPPVNSGDISAMDDAGLTVPPVNSGDISAMDDAGLTVPIVKTYSRFGKSDDYQKVGNDWYRVKADGSLAADPASGLAASSLNRQAAADVPEVPPVAGEVPSVEDFGDPESTTITPYDPYATVEESQAAELAALDVMTTGTRASNATVTAENEKAKLQKMIADGANPRLISRQTTIAKAAANNAKEAIKANQDALTKQEQSNIADADKLAKAMDEARKVAGMEPPKPGYDFEATGEDLSPADQAAADKAAADKAKAAEDLAKQNPATKPVTQSDKDIKAAGQDLLTKDPTFAESIKQGFKDLFSEMFEPKEIARMIVNYAGSRALGYDHGTSLNYSAQTYTKTLAAQEKQYQKDIRSKEYQDFTEASRKEFEKTRDYSVLKKKPAASGVKKRGGKMYHRRLGVVPTVIGMDDIERVVVQGKEYNLDDPRIAPYLEDFQASIHDVTDIKNEFRNTGKGYLDGINQGIEKKIDQIPASQANQISDEANTIYNTYKKRYGGMGTAQRNDLMVNLNLAQQKYYQDYKRWIDNGKQKGDKPISLEAYFKNQQMNIDTGGAISTTDTAGTDMKIIAKIDRKISENSYDRLAKEDKERPDLAVREYKRIWKTYKDTWTKYTALEATDSSVPSLFANAGGEGKNAFMNWVEHCLKDGPEGDKARKIFEIVKQ